MSSNRAEPRPRAASDDGALTVFRPRRRCERCGLVNADSSARCRRCHARLGEVDRAQASEQLVRRLRARRAVVAGVLVLVAAGLAAVGVATYLRMSAMAHFAENASRVETDLAALERGARSDAAAVADAFDDREAREALGEQVSVWSYRAARCDEVAAAMRVLVPRGVDEARRLADLERRVEVLGRASRALDEAARLGDVEAARRAASALAAGAAR